LGDKKRKRVFSGMRPTGRLHLGHYFGALQNWVKLQDQYDCFFCVVDWHALTTHYEDTSSIAENTLQVATDWLAVGLDPAKATLFIQSSVLEHAELHLLLSMITPLGWLERVPTYKEQIENLKDRDLGTYGFLGYPLLQTADIVLYDGELVPVGEDQVPHIELAREVVRRFCTYFGTDVKPALFAPENRVSLRAMLDRIGPHAWEGVGSLDSFDANAAARARHNVLGAAAESGLDNFVGLIGSLRKFLRRERLLAEPRPLLTETPRLPGTDGRRMAKSYGNAIWLSDPPEEIRTKARNMMTDPQRVRRTDPGRPEVCPVFAYHKLFSTPETIAQVDRECRTAAIGCVDCKKLMADALVKWIEPIQAQRQKYEANPKEVWDILDAGSNQARKMAKKTMRRVREAIFKWDEAPARRPAGGRKPDAAAPSAAKAGN
jgi:tryptophanyl-tRNA synthetase